LIPRLEDCFIQAELRAFFRLQRSLRLHSCTLFLPEANRMRCLLLIIPLLIAAEPFPNTKPLEIKEDLAKVMVDGIHRFLDQKPRSKSDVWKINGSSLEAYKKSIEPNRIELKKILGIGERLPANPLQLITTTKESWIIAEAERYSIHRVRWNVLPGIDGEGLLLEPKSKPHGTVIAIPDAVNTPEQFVGLEPGITENRQWARRLAEQNFRVIVPVLINREDSLSGNKKLNRATNLSHREFIYRMAFEMGQTLIGLEVQKVLSLVDAYATQGTVSILGTGEGGLISLYAMALDDRIENAFLDRSFRTKLNLDQEPIDRNIWGIHLGYSDVELLNLTLSREVMIACAESKTAAGPKPQQGRSQAAPGEIITETYSAIAPIEKQIKELKKTVQFPTNNHLAISVQDLSKKSEEGTLWVLCREFSTDYVQLPSIDSPKKTAVATNPVERHERQFQQLVTYIQKRWRDSDATRRDFWKKANPATPQTWETSTESYRNYFWEDVIGKLPKATKPFNPRTRVIYDTPKWTGYEVVLDVYNDVIAYGILLWPKDLKPGEKRPVVVCQHGLEGRPTDICNPNEKTKYYNSQGAQLADRGYIVYAPQNPYIFQNHFRQIQRKANPLKLSLFSFIIRQHEQTLNWLKTLDGVDPKRLAFYGLSYGGKTAMRVPAVLKDYCLSICSGDFNEWIGKNVSVDYPGSYMWTGEYEMYEFDLGSTYNYAEMAYLIAPRPFMVERGHDDGVGIDEMVAYEFAKVRYLFANKLKLAERTEIEFFAGGHEIHGQGTFKFLDHHLQWKPK
jgi:dienelactone hydrolase